MAITIADTRGIPSLATSLGTRLLASIRRRMRGGPRVARSTFVPRTRDHVQPRG